MSEWETVRVADIAAPGGLAGGPFGSSLGSKDYVPSGVPVIRGINLSSDGKFDLREFVYVTSEKVERELLRNLAQPGDVVFTQRGTLGQVGIVPDSPYERYVISQSQMRLRADPARAIPDFVYYQFKSPAMLTAIQNHAITTGVPHINLSILGELSLALPPLSVQEAVSAVLGALDNKIAVNNRIAQEADELQTVSLRHWMSLNQDQAEDRPLSSFARFVNGRAFTKDATGTGRMVIRIAEINSGPGASTVHNDIDVPDVHLACPGDILFAWSGSLTVKRWYRPEAIINQHIFKVIPNAGVPGWLAYELIKVKLDDFIGIAADKATTMGHIQRRHLDELVLAPKQEHMESLDAELGPLWDRALAAEQESLKLEEIRDTLLPRLTSGEIRVREAERVVEDAT